MTSRQWVRVDQVIINRNYMFFARVKGHVLEVSENSYENKKGEKIEEKVLSVHQEGNRQLLEIRVPKDSVVEKGDEFDGECVLSPWAKDGRSGFFVSVRKD